MLPISNIVPQYINPVTGAPYAGAVLKCYRAGTSTLLQIATDRTGSTLINDVQLNASGNPEVSGSVIIPHVSQDYKLSLFPNQAAADSNSGALWTVDNLSLSTIASSVPDTVGTFSDLRDYEGLSDFVVTQGRASIGDGEGRSFRRVINAPPGSYTDNDQDVIVPSGGDGSSAFLHISSFISAASTATPGIVQLNDTVTSTSTTEAATPNSVRVANEAAAAANANVNSHTHGESGIQNDAITSAKIAPGVYYRYTQVNLPETSVNLSGTSWQAVAINGAPANSVVNLFVRLGSTPSGGNDAVLVRQVGRTSQSVVVARVTNGESDTFGIMVQLQVDGSSRLEFSTVSNDFGADLNYTLTGYWSLNN